MEVMIIFFAIMVSVVFILGIGLLFIYGLLSLATSSLRDHLKAQRQARAKDIAQHSVTVEVD